MTRLRAELRGLMVVSALAGCALSVAAQSANNERIFPQSKTVIEKTLKAMQPRMSGRLPIVDGFATDAEHPLDRYQRAYYQAEAQVTATPSGGSRVRVVVKVTAWYSDPQGFRSGYQLLKSNGRLEADLLDQLSEQLSTTAMPAPASPEPGPVQKPGVANSSNTEPTLSAPAPNSADSARFSSALKQGLDSQSLAKSLADKSETAKSDKSVNALQAEADGLEQILKSQAHPKNLVAVRKTGTPVVASPSLKAKTLFLASLHDEFEMLDFTQDWVHVRVSGLSRGWIWRDNLEMPEGIPDTLAHSSASSEPAGELFHVVREEAASFPGDWQPLRGKNVKIVSIQKIDEKGKDGGPQEKLEYAKYLLDKNFAELVQKQANLAGIVLIFDSIDGGMVAATAATLQQWKSGALSDSALWHNCFFDPPETFISSPPSGTQ
jgi:hypothetical protein